MTDYRTARADGAGGGGAGLTPARYASTADFATSSTTYVDVDDGGGDNVQVMVVLAEETTLYAKGSGTAIHDGSDRSDKQLALLIDGSDEYEGPYVSSNGIGDGIMDVPVFVDEALTLAAGSHVIQLRQRSPSGYNTKLRKPKLIVIY